VPSKYSDEKVAYFWKPTLDELKDLFSAAADNVVDGSQQAKQLRFFAAVLDRGVPAVTRDAFEKGWQALNVGSGRASASQQAQLLADFPGIAVAYSPATWVKSFPGLDYNKFFAPPAQS
jgi:hypothetical protein